MFGQGTRGTSIAPGAMRENEGELVMLVNILLWALFGLIAGAVAKWILPGKSPGGERAGWVITIVLGIAGAILGGYLGSHLLNWDVTGFNLQSFALAIGGAVLVLIIYRLVVGAALTR